MYIKASKRKGSALIVVIVAFAVIMILCTSIIGIEYADALSSIRQEKSVEAYQVARSGVDIGIKKLEQAIVAANTAGKYYSSVSDFISDPVVQPYLVEMDDTIGDGQYKVTFNTSSEFTDKDVIKIYSEGTEGNVKNTTALQLFLSCPNINPTGWINNGWNVKAGKFSMNKRSVVFKTGKKIGHPVKKDASSPTVFKAPSIHFMDLNNDGFAAELTPKPFTLESNFISFAGGVVTDKSGKDNGILYLQVYDNEDGTKGLMGPASLTLPAGSSNYTGPFNTPLSSFCSDIATGDTGYGVVYLKDGLYGSASTSDKIITLTDALGTARKEGYYFFKETRGATLTLNLNNPDDRNAKMIYIDEPDIINYLDWLYSKETNLSINMEGSIWSKK